MIGGKWIIYNILKIPKILPNPGSPSFILNRDFKDKPELSGFLLISDVLDYAKIG